MAVSAVNVSLTPADDLSNCGVPPELAVAAAFRIDEVSMVARPLRRLITLATLFELTRLADPLIRPSAKPLE